MLKNVLLAGAAAAVLGAIAVPARADTINANQWYAGAFGLTNGTPLTGSITPGTNAPILPSGTETADLTPTVGGNLSATITLSNGGYLLVTDVEAAGDQFQMFVNGVAATPTSAGSLGGQQSYNGTDALGNSNNGLTSLPTDVSGHFCAGPEDITCALSDTEFSSGTFSLPAGTDIITGIYIGNTAVTSGSGDMDYIVEPNAAGPAVPEPASLTLLGLGLAGLGAIRRRRRH